MSGFKITTYRFQPFSGLGGDGLFTNNQEQGWPFDQDRDLRSLVMPSTYRTLFVAEDACRILDLFCNELGEMDEEALKRHVPKTQRQQINIAANEGTQAHDRPKMWALSLPGLRCLASQCRNLAAQSFSSGIERSLVAQLA